MDICYDSVYKNILSKSHTFAFFKKHLYWMIAGKL